MIDIQPVRRLIQADGGDVELVGFDDGVARLRLVLADAHCAECVLPRQVLESVALKVLQAGEPALRAVRVDDPREGPSA